MSEIAEKGQDDGEPTVLGVDSDGADKIIGALSSDTAREILAKLHETPGTPSEIADVLDTSVQNARYHLNRLEEAGLIRVSDTEYSPKGREMNVYSPNNQPLVFYTGTEDDSGSLKKAIKRFFGGAGILAFVSIALEYIWGMYFSTPGTESGVASQPATFDSAGDGQALREESAGLTEQAAQEPGVIEAIQMYITPGTTFFVVGTIVLFFTILYIHYKDD